MGATVSVFAVLFLACSSAETLVTPVSHTKALVVVT